MNIALFQTPVVQQTTYKFSDPFAVIAKAEQAIIPLHFK